MKGDVARIVAYPGTGLVGIAVSKKVGSRPRRNLLKRRFREAVSDRQNLLNQELDYVVVVNAEATEASFERIRLDVRALFAKVIDRWAAESESS